MSLLGAILAVLAALAFSGFDATRKRAGEKLHPLALTVWLQIASLPLFLGWAGWSGWSWSPRWLEPGLVSVALQALASGLFLTALTIAPLSRTVPFLALTPVLSAAAGWAVLGERPSSLALLGMGLVTVGAFALALARTSGGFRIETGSLLTIIVAALWSVSGAIDKRALMSASPSTHALLLTAGVLVVFLVERAVRGGPNGLRLPPGAGRRIIAAGVFGTLALGLQLSAFEHAMVSTVETVKRAVGGAMALLLGRWFFGEAVPLRAVLAVAVMTVGTILVLWPTGRI